MQNPFNPHGGVNPLIDKMIGNAYDIVKYVAKYLREIRYVAENMQYVYAAANGNRTQLAITGDGVSTSLQAVIANNYDYDTLISATVVAVLPSGMMYFPAENTFNFGITPGFVVISIAPDVPDLLDAEYRITLTNTLPE